MTFREHLALLKRLDYLIKIKGTGNYLDLSRKLEVSKASIYRYLGDLRDMGALIEYCRHRKSFYYKEPFSIKF